MGFQEPDPKRARLCAAAAPSQRVEETQKALENLAARAAPGHSAGLGPIIQKQGMRTKRLFAGKEDDTIVLGGACSEVFSGPTFAKILKPALALQQQACESLSRGEACEPICLHTSYGVPAALGGFIAKLKEHLPWQNPGDKWFVNLQVEGATAVWAGVEVMMRLQHAKDPKKTHVAVAEKSYHGPKTTSLGQISQPRWPGAPVAEGQLSYPVPTGSDPDSGDFLKRFDAFLEEHGDRVGVFLFEPQSGSSYAGRPWPKALLQGAVQRVKARGIKVLCDEIMCGLGRHGLGTLFMSKAWQLEPDVVTFGKSISAGPFPLSGIIVKDGADELQAGLVQVHTYAGTSALAMLTATEVLKEVPNWFNHAHKMGELIRTTLELFNDGKFLTVQGMGLLWGGTFVDADPARKLKTLELFKAACQEDGVWPYFVLGGFMLTPPMDVDEADLKLGLERLTSCLKKVKQQLEN